MLRPLVACLLLTSLTAAQQPAVYSDRASLPGLIFPVASFSTKPNADGESKGFEISSAVFFRGKMLVTDDETKAVEHPNLRGKDKDGFAVFELKPDIANGQMYLERPFREAFDIINQEKRAFDDLENMTARDNTLYLMGSHSFNKRDERRPQREVILRIEYADDGSLVSAQRRPTEMRDRIVDLIAGLPEMTMTRERIATSLNIEGLTVVPNSPDLLIGVKRPLIGPDEKALVLRLKNPDAFFTGDFAILPIEVEALLSTDRSGIASMEWDPIQRGYLIATNFKADYPGSSLWLWDGQSASPREICRFRAMALEGVARITSGPWRGKLMLAFDEETIDENYQTLDGGVIAIVDWGGNR